MKAKIISLKAGIYTLHTEHQLQSSAKLYNSQSNLAHARGLFRKNGIKPMVGDIVECENSNDPDIPWQIHKIYTRKNELIRPNISNIDYLAIMISLAEPKADLLLLDKLLVIAKAKNIIPLIIFTKADLLCESEFSSSYYELFSIYYNLYPNVYLSSVKDIDEVKLIALAKNLKIDFDEFKSVWDKSYLTEYRLIAELSNKIYSTPIMLTEEFKSQNSLNVLPFESLKTLVLTGQSGVGKSSFINRFLFKNFINLKLDLLDTSELSDKIARGKHTTRSNNLFYCFNNSLNKRRMEIAFFLADTPGFSSLDLEQYGIDETEIEKAFPEISKYAADCYFDNCRHLKENRCAVSANLTEDNMRLKRYRILRDELLKKKKYNLYYR